MIVDISNRLQKVEEYYFSRKLKEIAELENSGVSIINLGIGKPDMPPAAPIIDTLREFALEPSAHGYQSYKGIPELRESISEYYQRHFDTKVDPNTEVLPLMGSKEGIMHISMAFLNQGDEVLIPNPGYPTYANATRLAGAEPIFYNLEESHNYQIDIKELDRQKTERTKIIWVNYPHMPTGALGNIEKFEALVDWAKRNKVLIASDAPYSFILNDNRCSIMSIEGAKEVCIELNSLSKSHSMSGWRVGMAISSAEIINAVLRFKSNMASGMFRPIQSAAITAMQIDDQWYKTNDKIYKSRREEIWKLLDLIGFSYEKESAGLFVWSKVSDRFSSGEEASDLFLKKARVFVPPGMIFGSQGHMYVRWSLCQPTEIINEASRAINIVMNY